MQGEAPLRQKGPILALVPQGSVTCFQNRSRIVVSSHVSAENVLARDFWGGGAGNGVQCWGVSINPEHPSSLDVTLVPVFYEDDSGRNLC